MCPLVSVVGEKSLSNSYFFVSELFCLYENIKNVLFILKVLKFHNDILGIVTWEIV